MLRHIIWIAKIWRYIHCQRHHRHRHHQLVLCYLNLRCRRPPHNQLPRLLSLRLYTRSLVTAPNSYVNGCNCHYSDLILYDTHHLHQQCHPLPTSIISLMSTISHLLSRSSSLTSRSSIYAYVNTQHIQQIRRDQLRSKMLHSMR